jgi:deoxyribodipyrimidine photo-lyase
MDTAIVVFTRDLRLHDNPALHPATSRARDVINNAGNWQWIAGTGNNTRPNRIMNPLRQASRFDPSGDYIRRYVPELSALYPPHIHTPWHLPAGHHPGYPAPIVELT